MRSTQVAEFPTSEHHNSIPESRWPQLPTRLLNWPSQGHSAEDSDHSHRKWPVTGNDQSQEVASYRKWPVTGGDQSQEMISHREWPVTGSDQSQDMVLNGKVTSQRLWKQNHHFWATSVLKRVIQGWVNMWNMLWTQVFRHRCRSSRTLTHNLMVGGPMHWTRYSKVPLWRGPIL